MKVITEIIKSIESKDPHINPTEIYNEGWMTRILTYYSIHEKVDVGFLDFSKINNWTSEALFSSPFVIAKDFREGYTHADMALGDFHVDYGKRGEIILNTDAKIFGIIEAKMGSNLSQGTSKVQDYNQASRNVTCIAYNTFKTECDIFFGVVAPKKKLKDHNIEGQINESFIKSQITERFNLYPLDFREENNMSEILAKVDECRIWMLSYESWIDCFADHSIKAELLDFYYKALKYNRID